MIEVNIALSDMLLINEAMKKADDNEIGGFGTIMYTDSGAAYVNHLYIPKQDISGTEVDWGMDGVLDFVNYLNEQGDNRSYRGIFSWHSHADMPPFWSSTDEKFIRLAGTEGVPYIFSVVLNNKGERKERLDVFAKTDCKLIKNGYIQVEYGDDEVNLNVYESQKITERRAEVDSIKEAMEAEISAITAERDKEIEEIKKNYGSDIEAAKKHVTNMTNSLRGDAKKHVEDIWEERITEKYDYISYSGRWAGGWADDSDWQQKFLLGSGFEDIDDVVAELGEDIMYYTFDDKKQCFTSDVIIPGVERDEISIEEAKLNWVDVYDLVNGEIKNVSVYQYLKSNYDMDDEEGEYELVTLYNSYLNDNLEAAETASTK